MLKRNQVTRKSTSVRYRLHVEHRFCKQKCNKLQSHLSLEGTGSRKYDRWRRFKEFGRNNEIIDVQSQNNLAHLIFLGPDFKYPMSKAAAANNLPEIHHLRPLITYSSPSNSIDDWIFVASDEATLRKLKTLKNVND